MSASAATMKRADFTNKLMAALQNSEGQLTEREAAAMAGRSSRTFRRLIRSVFGESFRVLRLKVKLECAKRILLDSQLAIPAISSRLGYTSRFKFECSFKKQFGLTPTQFRKRPAAKMTRLKEMATQGIDNPQKVSYRAPRVQKQNDADRY